MVRANPIWCAVSACESRASNLRVVERLGSSVQSASANCFLSSYCSLPPLTLRGLVMSSMSLNRNTWHGTWCLWALMKNRAPSVLYVRCGAVIDTCLVLLSPSPYTNSCCICSTTWLLSRCRFFSLIKSATDWHACQFISSNVNFTYFDFSCGCQQFIVVRGRVAWFG